MAKISKLYACENCGAEYAAWQGQCSSCKEWNTIIEQTVAEKVTQTILNNSRAVLNLGATATLRNLNDLHKEVRPRLDTELPELNRVLGEGLMAGSVVLLTGEPGIGKSTLLLQLAQNLSTQGKDVVYISAEESLEQIANRAQRLAGGNLRDYPKLRLINSFNLEQIRDLFIAEKETELFILDSIQTIMSDAVRGIPGGMAQIRYCAAELTSLAKQLGKSLILVGHINKEGTVAGPKVLEHLVDVVLNFSGEESSSLRMLRPLKNRFGSIDEVGIFLMGESGLESVTNPGEYFLGETVAASTGQIGVCRTVVLEGQRPLVMEIQALAVRTDFAYPKRVSEGVSLPRLQVICAVLSKYLRLNLHDFDIYVNVAQGFKLKDRGVDLAIALAIASSVQNKQLKGKLVAFGEVNLSGRITPGIAPQRREKELKRLGYKHIASAATTPFIKDLAQHLG